MSTPPPPPPEDPVERTSVLAKLFDLLATPGDVYEELRGAPVVVANWLVPLLLACVGVAVFSVVAFSQPGVVHQLRQTQETAIREALKKQGMNGEKIEQAIAQTQKFMTPGVLKLTAIVGGVVALFVMVLGKGLALWLLDRMWFRTGTGYHKHVEIVGLAEVITVLSCAAKCFLVVATGNLYLGLGPALLLAKFDPTNPAHLALNAVDMFVLWQLAVIAIGMVTVTRMPWSRAVMGVGLLWLLLVAMSALPALAAR